MKKYIKPFLIILSLLVFASAGISAAVHLARLGSTTGAGINVTDLYNDPDNYDVSDANGIADIIISEDLEKTGSANAVTAVVFDFRGYDTIGESFVLLTAISGSMVILRSSTRKKQREADTIGRKK